VYEGGGREVKGRPRCEKKTRSIGVTRLEMGEESQVTMGV
jgi:hypothetical protein